MTCVGPCGGETAFLPRTGVIPGRTTGNRSGSLLLTRVVRGTVVAPRGAMNRLTILTSTVPETPGPKGALPHSTVALTSHVVLGHHGPHKD